ncbi:MAG TPA: hypothetical protein VFO54_00120 [Chryseosolibacter sp.]|nr:hypothetical protein [Chryseosolibacter sp.]
MDNVKIIRIWPWLGFFLIMNACYHDQIIPVEPTVGDVGTVTFASGIIPIFNSSCNVSGCHSPGGQKPNLSSESAFNSLMNGGYIDKATPEKSLVYQWMKGDKGTPMPVSGSNPTYNAKILAWIEQGALNN